MTHNLAFWMKRLRLFSAFLIVIGSTYAQQGDKDNQWWIGIKAGVNTTIIETVESYSPLSFSDADTPEKDYNIKSQLGYQVGILGTWDFWSSFTLSLQPYFAHHVFNYETTYEWTSPTNVMTIKNEHMNSYDYVYIPLLLRYELRFPSIFGGGGGKKNKPVDHGHNHQKNKRLYSSKMQKGGAGAKGDEKAVFIPYLQVGYFYSRLLGAEKVVTYTETVNGFEQEPADELIGITDLSNKANHGLLLGGGFSYDIGGSFRVAFDINYQLNMDLLTNQKNRYTNDKLVQQYYDVPDDIKMRNWDFSLHLIFPLKFVYSGNFKSI